MPAEFRGPAYRAALSEANLELEQLCERLAALRVRKGQLQGVVTALEPLMIAQLVQSVSPEPVAAPVQVTHQASVVKMPAERKRETPREAPMDPLQRQINQALGMAALA